MALPTIAREWALGLTDLIGGTRTGELTPRGVMALPAASGVAAKIAGRIPKGALGAYAIHDMEVPQWYNASRRMMEDAVQIYERPTKADVRKLLKKHSALRAAKDTSTGDTFVWDAEAGLHEDAIRNIGRPMVDNAGTIFSLDDFSRIAR